MRGKDRQDGRCMPCKNRTERPQIRSVYINCEGVCKKENILKLGVHQSSGLESSG